MKLENASNSQLHQTIKLVDGEFSKLQALDIISALIDQKINYHKVEGMQLWESNHHADGDHINLRIEELLKAKEEFKNYLKDKKGKEVRFTIKGALEIHLVGQKEAH